LVPARSEYGKRYKSTAHADGLVELAEAASWVSSSEDYPAHSLHLIEVGICTAPTLEARKRFH